MRLLLENQVTIPGDVRHPDGSVYAMECRAGRDTLLADTAAEMLDLLLEDIDYPCGEFATMDEIERAFKIRRDVGAAMAEAMQRQALDVARQTRPRMYEALTEREHQLLTASKRRVPATRTWDGPAALFLLESSIFLSRGARGVSGRRVIVVHDLDERELIDEIVAFRGYVLTSNARSEDQLW
ncbi:hypothetical protein GCM10022288_11620 [Gryllotalpicola kribbensis]|uniref:Uncharacterized protein n=1 Tax=Gryllotalpicola kribbensis TaxID=993084 RepID=A0ABP8APT3_9MICO